MLLYWLNFQRQTYLEALSFFDVGIDSTWATQTWPLWDLNCFSEADNG